MKATGDRLRIAAVLLGLAAVSLTPGTAAAQTTAPDARMFVGGLAGVTFGSDSAAIVGGRFGHRIARNLHVFVEVDRITDVTPQDIRDQIDEFIALIGDDLPLTFKAKVPATVFAGGVRWSRSHGRLSPFAEAGAGIGHLSADIEVSIAGLDVSDAIRDEIGADLSVTKFLVMFGGGVNVAFTPSLSVDAGYRFTRIFTDDPAVNTSAVYGALIWRVR